METHFRQKEVNCIKVVLFGPESTGKTTLCNQLASYFETCVVPEYMRTYLQEKWDNTKTSCQKIDLLPIAKGQIDLENKISPLANRVVFCDTNLREIKVYSKAYYNGFCPENIRLAVNTHNYNLYLLTYIDTPWQADDLRDKPNERIHMFQKFKEELDKNKCNYSILKGTKEERLKTAIKHINQLL